MMLLLSAVLASLLPGLAVGQGPLRRCYQCRSRGEQGDCRDPFTPPEAVAPGLPAPAHKTAIFETPCSSGWCSKILEGVDKNSVDDYGIATERSCMQRAPSDGSERCAYVKYNHQEVYMCFCHGDLCNTAPHRAGGAPVLLTLLLAPLLLLLSAPLRLL